MTQLAQKRQRVFRKQLILPAEHGSWAWLLVPFVVGAAVAGTLSPAVVATLAGGLAAFLMRQPATIWLRAYQGRGRRADGPAAAGGTLLLALVATLCLATLLAQGRNELLWLLGPLAFLFLIYLAAAARRRASTRALWMELAGAAGLAAMAPAAHVAATGSLSHIAWALWTLMAAQNTLGVLYVRLRLADSRRQPANRAAVFWSHGAGLAAVAFAVALGLAPLLVAVPFAGFWARAGWTALKPRPVANVKRFGFTEVAVEILSGLLIIAAYSTA